MAVAVMKDLLNKLTEPALALLFPLHCLGCRKEGRMLCATCVAALPRLEPPYCAICAQPAVRRECRRCAELPLEIDGIRSPFLMEGVVQGAVHSLKYRGIRAVSPELGQLLAEFLSSQPIPGEVIVPVPLHRRRLRSRGYNQSALLARDLGKLTGLPVNEGLVVRIKDTPPQVSLSRQERVQNVKGSFQCVGDAVGQAVLLLDDVVTTGSTMSACSTALKEAGAVSVWGMALAREP